MHGLLEDIGISIIAATIIGFAAHRINQPVILGYLIAGAFIGPEIGLKLVTNPVNIEVISEVGLILLLFIIGLEMNLQKILTSGKALLLTGVGQFVFCVLLGLGVFPFFGYSLSEGNIDGLYLSLLCALSSTAIVVKLLYDKAELDTLSGRITLGVLIIQDIWAILILAFQPNFRDPQFMLFGLAILKGFALLGLGFMLSKYVLRFIYETIAKSPEMVAAISIGWCALISGVAGFIGLSKEMGALIAGLSISSFPYSIHVTAKVLPLRDFFLTLFFISLGMKIPLPQTNMIIAISGIVLFVIISRFLTVYPLLLWAGSGRRTGFISSLNLSQVSEFSLVIASLGVSYGHIQKDIMSLVIYSMAFTSVASSYFIKFNHEIYVFFENMLERLWGRAKEIESKDGYEGIKTHSIVILGFHRGAKALIELIAQRNPKLLKKILVIDFNPEILNELKAMNVNCLFGDVSSVDTLRHAHIEDAKIILSTIPDMLLKGTNNLKLVKTCRDIAPQASIIAIADSEKQIKGLKEAGADEILLPYALLGESFAKFILSYSYE